MNQSIPIRQSLSIPDSASNNSTHHSPVILSAAEEPRHRSLTHTLRTALADEREAIRQADEDFATGRTRPAASVFQQMRKQYGL